MRVNLQHKTNILKFIRMKNLFTIIAASLLLGTASMAAADPDFVIVSAEHTGIDNNPAYLDLRPTTRHAISTFGKIPPPARPLPTPHTRVANICVCTLQADGLDSAL